MTDDTDTTDRLDRLESLVDRQQETIDALRAQVDESGENDAQTESEQRPAVSRRTTLKAGGLAGLLALGAGVGTASADPSGQVGTGANPLRTLHTDELNGGITGDVAVTDLVGGPLAVDGEQLTVAVDDPLEISGGAVSLAVGDSLRLVDGALEIRPFTLPPADLEGVLAGMEQDGDTYVITNVHELQAMNADLDADYRLGADVDAGTTALWNDDEGFDPIGELNDPFVGTFDGDGHVVEGLTIDRENESDVGLFGRNEGDVERIGVVDVDVTGDGSVGGLVGRNSSEVVESYVTGAVSGNDDVGGLVGSNVDFLDDSYANCVVVGDENVGGLAGTNVDGFLSSSYATCEVSGDDAVGGLLGHNSQTGSVNSTYWDHTRSDGLDDGDGIGDGSGGVTALDTGEMTGAEEDLDDMVADFDFDDTWATVTDPDDYPVLQALDEDTQLEARE